MGEVGPSSCSVQLHEYHSFCLRGEGRANFVVSAKSDKSGLRIVWRLAKHRKSGTVTIKPKCHLVMSYFDKLIVPILGREFLVKPRTVHIDVESLHHLAKVPSLPVNVKVDTFSELMDECKFPASSSYLPRRSICEVDYITALEMIDATGMSDREELSNCYGPTITFEIKPKQGFFQNHPDVHVPYCNNCILQLEKCYSEAYDQMYDFCPLDLYSGDLDRMRHALNALVAVPHRNLRIFIDGSVVHSDEVHSSVQDLTHMLLEQYNLSLDQLITALCCVLAGCSSEENFAMHRSSVLARMLAAQRIDTIGIVTAYHIYNRLSHNVQRELLSKSVLPSKGLSSILKRDSDRALIERYLLAATVKDCSLMITLRQSDPLPSQRLVHISQPPTFDGIEHASVKACSFAYNINVVDLDPKSPKNLLNAYERFMNGVKIIGNVSSHLRRPCVH